MRPITTTELREPGVRTNASLRVRSFSVDDCRDVCSVWDGLRKPDRQRLLGSGAVPVTRDTDHRNATCEGLHRQLAQLFAVQRIADYGRFHNPPTAVLLGDDWGGGASSDPAAFSSTDTALNNQVGEISLTDPAGVGRRWTAQELIGSLELRDATIREWGVQLENGGLANHGPVEPAIARSDSENTLLDIAIPLGDTSEVSGGQLP